MKHEVRSLKTEDRNRHGMHTIRVKPGREKSLLRHHPWLFSGAIKDPRDAISSGSTVRITDDSGRVLALGAWSPQSQIRVRIWCFDPAQIIDRDFFRRRIEIAVALRGPAATVVDGACRLVNAEADGLPGVIVDRYGAYLVCQFLAAGAEHWKQVIVDSLKDIMAPRGIYQRSDAEVRLKEGLQPAVGLLAGEEPPEIITIERDRLRLLVDVRHGHKTGLYLDQALNYRIVAEHSADQEVLNGFGYSGGFALAALRGGAARVTSVEASAEALALYERHLQLNGFGTERCENITGDCFEVFRKFRDQGRQFDLVTLDPPKFVNSAQQLQRGSRGYKDINLLAMKLLRRNGVLITFSCSGHVSPELFQKILADAALDAGRTVHIMAWLSQSPDHPVALNFPESRYLKGLLCRVI